MDNVADMSSLFEVFILSMKAFLGGVWVMRMFFGATSFSGNVLSWDVSSVTNMRGMLKGAASFNENLCAWSDTFPYSNAHDIFAS